MMRVERTLFGRPICGQVQRLDEGVHVLLTGGDRSHIGAYSLAEPGQAPQTTVFPGHKDQYLSEPWAAAIAEKTGQRTLVVCGIHYDGATKAQIQAIVETAQSMLEEILEKL